MLKKIVLLCAILCAYQIQAQIVGSRSNSDLSPANVEASQLSGGGFSGDVNVFNGTYNASYPIGAVSTPGGLNYAVNLNYSPSYSVGQTPSVSSGIPYGEGWNLSIPMITVSNAAYFSFLATYECNKKNQIVKDTNNYFDTTTISANGMRRPAATMNGDAFWFSPHVSIPGVGSGRAVFKYIDEDDADCAVFVLNKFEQYIELRFYGDRWQVNDGNGNQYEFLTTVVTYRAPSNTRVLNYNSFNNDIDNNVNEVIEDNLYGNSANEVLNSIEPKQAFTSWYCSVITNRNIPNQSILFEYEKFGAFNYFKEFEQPLIELKIADKLRDNLTLGAAYDYLDYTSYTDILLTKVTSFVQNSPFEILDLGYATSDLIGTRMLDPDDAGVERLDSLYAYTTVFSDGLGDDDFDDWERYYHGKAPDAYTITGDDPVINNRNPYYTTSNNGAATEGYIRDEVGTVDDITFNHAFLESPRILDDATTMVPGDIYEIRTKVTDANGSDAAMGTGTIDIAVVTGDLGFELGHVWASDVTEPCDSSGYVPTTLGSTYSSLNNQGGSTVYSADKYEKTRGTQIFTTQNQAVKWHLASEATSVSTSNFFVMPSIPNSYDGVNVQIGPGNSDTEYGNSTYADIETNEGGTKHPTAYNGYSHIQEESTALASYEDVPLSFGIGMPWSMAAPIYVDQMGGPDTDNAQHTNAFEFWYNDRIPASPYLWDNEPTKFNENVRLKEVEVIRYSKTPYMLSTVKMYRVNGEVNPLDDTSGIVLIAQSELDYSYESKFVLENYPYTHTNTSDPLLDSLFPCYIQDQDTLIHSGVYNQYVYTLDNIKNIPVAGWEDNPGVADSYADTNLLQTDFEYEWYGYEDGEVLVFDVDGYPGRRTKVMTKYIDQLGGETQISYYPRDSKNTLKEGRYAGTQKCASYGTSIFGQSVAYDIHPSVQYITKLDEKNNMSAIIPGAPLKRWEYVYDTTQIIYQTFDYNLLPNFRGGYKKSYSKGFAKSTVYDPQLETGEQNYTEYYHHGNVYQPDTTGGIITPDTSSITEYLYFGKPEKIIQYNYLDQKEEETIFEYGYTKAFENGYARNRTSRDNLLSSTDFESATNWVHAREYEYADYYKGETDLYNGLIGFELKLFDGNPGTSLAITIGDTTIYEMDQVLAYTNPDGVITSVAIPGYTDSISENHIRRVSIIDTISGGLAKPIAVSGGYLGERWGGPYEKAKFLETYFYDDLQLYNQDFYFHSYFVKTVKKTSRSYDDYCYLDDENGGYGTIPVGETVDNNPFGPPYTNPITSAQGDNQLIMAINGSTDGTSVESSLISASPLSENVLTTFIGKIGQFNSSVIKNVLVAQSALSDNQLTTVFNGTNSLTGSDIQAIFADQPYLSDPFLISIIPGSSQYQDQLIKDIYNLNDYLSDTVMIEMAESSTFSANVLKDVLLTQGQMSEAVLVAIAAEGNSNASFAIEALMLNQPILTDTIFYELVENANISKNKIKSIYNNAQTYPSDNALISLMNRSQPLPDQDIILLLQASDHYFGDSLTTRVYAEIGLENADQAFEYQDGLNPYGLLCDEDLICTRDYIESVTEFEYYEANYDGSTLAEGYKKLMGLEDVEGKVITNATSGLGHDITLSNIQLKHLPSWQVFSVKSYSPDYPGAYSQEEYYYYYDQLNRKSRHFEYYDLVDGHFTFLTGPDYHNDTAIFCSRWPSDHQIDGAYEAHIPLHDGAKNSRRNNLRSIAFQKTVFTKNNDHTEPIMRSEYYNYDGRWNRPVIDIDTTITYSGPSCGSTDTLDCEECFTIKWEGSEEEVMAQVPWGYCAYYVSGSIQCCPALVDPEDCDYSVISQIGCNPTSEDPALDTVGYMVPLVIEALDKGLYFRSFVAQIDSVPSTSTDWVNKRTDKSNSYIMDFYLGPNDSDDDELGRRKAYAMYPFDTLTYRTIDQRNRYTQVQLEHNVSGIYTRYDFDTTRRVWYDNTNDGTCPAYGDYSTVINKNIGMPTRITVGVGRTDSMATDYSYYPNYSLDSIVAPNGYRSHFVYDDYDRLKQTYENSRLLSENQYAYWKRDTSLSFQERTAQNYVETNIYSGPSVHDEHIRSYFDPLGRNYSTSTSVDNDSTQVHSGTVWYDNWGRVTRSFKPYKLSDQASLIPQSDTTLAYTHGMYENTPKSRTIRSAKYGITNILDTHTVKQNFQFIDEAKLACELNLKAPEAALIIHPDFDGDFKFLRVETIDEDAKRMISYTNAIGQQVATMQFGESEEDELITLFVYDDYGNLTTVINPEEQWTHYEYNILGQLIKETTIDAGTTKFMYNKQGLLSLSQDENGRIGEVPPGLSDTTEFFRVFEYDDYGRLLTQKRVYKKEAADMPVENNPNIDPLFYTDTVSSVDGSGDPIILGTNPESYFEYHFSNKSSYDWMAEISYVDFFGGGGGGARVAATGLVTNFIDLTAGTYEKQFVYGADTTGNRLGKIKQSKSYNAEGSVVETITYTYNEVGQPLTEYISFNPTGDPADQINTKLTYPDYNYRGSMEYVQVDVANDSVMDFQYKYNYDDWNRLREIYVSFANGEDGNRVASYDYNDALGLLTVTKHYVNNSNAGCGGQEAQTVTYSYDVRDRLTNISSGLFDYSLYYDNNAPTHTDFTESVAYSQNWNGNINGLVANYKLDGAAVTNSGSIAGVFDKATVYGFKYDLVNRLYQADANAGDRVNTLITSSYGIGDAEYNYDRIGNITNLKRGLELSGTDLVNEEWDYKYISGTNKLKKVQGIGGTTSRNYTYDANGNLASDDHRSLSGISYARANYPFEITKGSMDISYLYSISDQRIYKETQDLDTTREYYLKNIGILDMEADSWTWYVSGADRTAKITPFDYQQPKNIGASTPSTLNDSIKASFYLYDHLGNTRVVYTPEVQCPTYVTYTIDHVADYYPYGKVLREFVTTANGEKFLTTQHERDFETGLDYRGARFYDADVARFLSLDQLAADYPSLSDYSYVAGNPLIFVDPSGKSFGNYRVPYPTGSNPLMLMCHEMKKYFAAIGGFFTFKWWGKGKVTEEKSVDRVGTVTVKKLQYVGASGEITTNFGEAILSESTDLSDYVDMSFSLYVGEATQTIYGPENAPIEVKQTTSYEVDQDGEEKGEMKLESSGTLGPYSASSSIKVDEEGEVTSTTEVSVGSGRNKVFVRGKTSSTGAASVEAGGQIGGKVEVPGGITVEGATGVSVIIDL